MTMKPKLLMLTFAAIIAIGAPAMAQVARPGDLPTNTSSTLWRSRVHQWIKYLDDRLSRTILMVDDNKDVADNGVKALQNEIATLREALANQETVNADLKAQVAAIDTAMKDLERRFQAHNHEGPPPPPPPPPVSIAPKVYPFSFDAGGPDSIVWIEQVDIDPDDNGTVDVDHFTQKLKTLVAHQGWVMLDMEGNWGWVSPGMKRNDAQFGIALDLVHATLTKARGVGIYAWPVTHCNENDEGLHREAAEMPITRAKVDFMAPSVYVTDSMPGGENLPCANASVQFALEFSGGKPVLPVYYHRTTRDLTLLEPAEVTGHITEIAGVTVAHPSGVKDAIDGVIHWSADRFGFKQAIINRGEVPAGVDPTVYVKWSEDQATCLIRQVIEKSTCVPPAKPTSPIVPPQPQPPPSGLEPSLAALPVTSRTVSVNTPAELVTAANQPGTAVTLGSSVSMAQTIRLANNVSVTGLPGVVVRGPGNAPAFHIPPGVSKVLLSSMRIENGSVKFGEPGQTKPADVTLEKIVWQSTGRYIDLVGGVDRGLFVECHGAGSAEYSIWGQNGLEFTARKCSFIGGVDQTMVRLYSIHRVWFDQCIIDTTRVGKQTFRFIDCQPKQSADRSTPPRPGHVKVTGCTIAGGRVTFGNSAERWWSTSDASFEFSGNTCNWEGDGNGCIEVQPAARNGVIKDNQITTSAGFTHGIWAQPCEAPNVSWTGNKIRSRSADAFAAVPNGATPACP